MVNFGLPLS